jgi:hypothetical protein
LTAPLSSTLTPIWQHCPTVTDYLDRPAFTNWDNFRRPAVFEQTATRTAERCTFFMAERFNQFKLLSRSQDRASYCDICETKLLSCVPLIVSGRSGDPCVAQMCFT